MTAAKTPSQRGAANRRRGHQAERDLAKWLRANGFPHAERAVRTGWATKDRASADPGDITGTPGLIWSVKDTAAESHTKWRAELTAMILGQDNAEACGLIVHKRRGHASPGEWWVWIMTPDLAALFGVRYYGPEWWRTTLEELVVHLHGAGYGTPPDTDSPVNVAERFTEAGQGRPVRMVAPPKRHRPTQSLRPAPRSASAPSAPTGCTRGDSTATTPTSCASTATRCATPSPAALSAPRRRDHTHRVQECASGRP